jgi:hypothetical protein
MMSKQPIAISVDLNIALVVLLLIVVLCIGETPAFGFSILNAQAREEKVSRKGAKFTQRHKEDGLFYLCAFA